MAVTAMSTTEPAREPSTLPGRAASGSTRLEAVDVLRGFALFGILVVNIQFLANPVLGPVTSFGAPLDRLASWLITWLFEAKFYVLFSFLFGYGLSLQLAGAARRSYPLGPRYARRLSGLLVLGVLHAVFFFVGDILVSYALLGAGLWLLRDWPARRLVAIGVGLLGLSLFTYAALGAAGVSFAGSPDRALQAAIEESARNYLGTFWTAAGQRVQDLALFYALTPLFNWPTALAMFAFGLAAGKVGMLEHLDAWLPALRRVLPWTLAVGLSGNALYATLVETAPPLARATLWALYALSAPVLSLAYATLVLLALRHHGLSRVVRLLQLAGHMSLTNYIGQALVGGLIFNGYGLGLFGRVSPLGLLGIALTIFVAQVALSRLWLEHFERGPDEWLLRSWTHLKWQPFLRRASRADR